MPGYRILIVDDDELQRELLVEYLEVAGYAVFEAGNGLEALERIGLLSPDLILLDVQMPELDGFETLRRLRHEGGHEDLPVVFLTSHGSEHLMIRGLELGAEDYLTKPISNSMLLTRVRTVLRRAQRYLKLEASLQGRLDDFELYELLQTFELNRKHATLRLLDMGAEIELSSGSILACRLPDREGVTHLSKILLEPRGRFVVDVHKNDSSTPNDESSDMLASVLFEVAQEVDEANRQLNDLGLTLRTGLRLVHTSEPVKVSTFECLSEIPQSPISEILFFMGGTLRENTQALVSALLKGDVEVVE